MPAPLIVETRRRLRTLASTVAARIGRDRDRARTGRRRTQPGPHQEVASRRASRARWSARRASVRGPSVLGRLKPRDRVRAAAIALASAGAAEVPGLCGPALDAAEPTGTLPPELERRLCRALLARWLDLDADTRARALATLPTTVWLEALVDHGPSDLTIGPDQRCAFAVALGTEEAAPIAAEAMAGAGRDGLNAAAGLLSRLLGAAADRDRAVGEPLIRAARSIVEGFEAHGRRELLGPVLRLIGRLRAAPPADAAPRELLRLVDDPDLEGHRLLRAALRRSETPSLRALAWRWVGSGPLPTAALERIARSTGPDDHAALLDNWHLALRPARAAALRTLEVRTRAHQLPARAAGPGSAGGRRTDARDEPGSGHDAAASVVASGGPLPTERELGQLGEAARRGLARLAQPAGLRPMMRRIALEPLLTDPDAAARIGLARAAATQDLSDLCLDPDPRVARTAALRWSSAGAADSPHRLPMRASERQRTRLSALLERAPTAPARRIARDERLRRSPWAPGVQGRLGLRRWLRDDPASLTDAAAALLRAGAGPQRLEVITALSSIDAAGLIGPALIERLGEPCPTSDDAHAAAAAATALGLATTTDGAADALARALDSHGDPRVRANAAEALARLALRTGAHDTARSALVPRLNDPEHRVRANAVRGLLRLARAEGDAGYEPAAVDALASMLEDERPEHRLAGAWAAQREAGVIGLGPRSVWGEVVRRVDTLATDELDARVRRRAEGCAVRVLAAARRSIEAAGDGGVARAAA